MNLISLNINIYIYIYILVNHVSMQETPIVKGFTLIKEFS